MQIGQICLVGLVGLVWGSFLNVLIWRLNDPKAPKFWQGRSLCPKCRQPIAWFDNLPLLSFCLLKGQCRHCKKTISWQYPLVELLTAISFIIASLLLTGLHPVTYSLASFLTLTGLHPVIFALVSCFIVVFVSDLVYGLIPDEVIFVGVILGFLSNLGDLGYLATAIAVALPFFVFAKFKVMGWGDVKLAFLMGLVLGWPKILVALWFGFVLGGATAVILLLLRKTRLSATIPLGPFLIFGLVISALWSQEVIRLLKF